MEKPFAINYNETQKGIVEILNKSNLHPCILLGILTPIYSEIQHLADEALRKEKEQYLKESAEK